MPDGAVELSRGRQLAGILKSHAAHPLPGQLTYESIVGAEFVGRIEQVRILTVPGERDVGRRSIHIAAAEHVGAIDRHTLRLVDRGCVAVIERVVNGQIHAERPLVVESHLHARTLDSLDRGKRTVGDPEGTVILQEVDPVSLRERARAVLGFKRVILAELARLAAHAAREIVQRVHVPASVGQQH